MLSQDLRDYLEDVDQRDPKARIRRKTYATLYDVARMITKMREARGFSKRELAKGLQTSHPTVLRWESPGYSGYTLSKLIELADFLGYGVSITFTPKIPQYTARYVWEGVNSVAKASPQPHKRQLINNSRIVMAKFVEGVK